MSDNLKKLGALAFALVAISVSSTAIHNASSSKGHDLIPSQGDEGLLSGQVTSHSIPINEFSPQQVANGITLPADEHNFFYCETGGDVGTHVHSLGDARAWAYEYTGNEPPFNGKFFISAGELEVNPQYDSIDTLRLFKQSGRYYIMNAVPLNFQCGEGLSLNEYCGDDICQRNNESAQTCPEDCNVCGDGVVHRDEQCDDRNTANFDGCNSSCLIEDGYKCTGEPSNCDLLIPDLPGPLAGCTDSDGHLIVETEGIYVRGSVEGTNVFMWQEDEQRSVVSPDPLFDYCEGNTIYERRCVEQCDTSNPNEMCSYNTYAHCEFGCSDGACIRQECPPCVPPPSGCEGTGTGPCGCGPYLNPDGSVCSSPQPGNDPKGHVTVKAIGAGDIAVENQRDINLLRFETGAEGADLLFTKAIFEAQQGSLHNARNYTLWVDTDGDNQVDTILEDGVNVQSGQVNFNNLAGGGYAIPTNSIIAFEVHADIQSSLTSNVLQLMFDDGAFTNSIEMEVLSDGSNLYGIERNGECNESNCEMTLSTVDSQSWSLVSQGDLYVTQDTQPLRNRQLLGGTLGEAILRLELHAENEPIDVTDIQFTSFGSVATSIDRLELYRSGESTKFAEATRGGCGSDVKLDHNPTDPNQRPGDGTVSTFCVNMENQQLIIAEGNDVDVIVRPRMKTDEQGGVSGQAIGLFLGSGVSDYDYLVVQARGAESNNDLTMSDQDGIAEGEIFLGSETATSNANKNAYIFGNENESVLSKITSITNANLDPNGTRLPPFTDSNGNPNYPQTMSIGQFKFAAAAHNNSKNGDNDVVFETIIFNVNATNVAIDAQSFKFYNKSDPTITVSCQPYSIYGIPTTGTSSGTLFIECDRLSDAIVDTEIDEGTDTTFVLQADVTNPNSAAAYGGASVLQVSLQKFSNFGVEFGFNRSHILWIDKDQSTDVIFNWIEYPETSVKSTSYNS